jgi:nitrilase
MARVAVVQAGSAMFDTPKTLERMQALCEAAAGKGAQLVLFPEAYIGGYPKGLDFGARIGSRTPAGRDDFLRYANGAIEVPGPVTRVLGGFAAEMRAHLVVGAVEREGATLYCTALFFGPDGDLLAKHRKLMPTASERLVWGLGDGSTLPVLDTPLGRVGAAICWENYMPLLRTALYARGIQIWCAPTVDEREIWQASMRHIAYEGRCFVLSACQFLTRADCPADYDCVQGEAPGTVLIRGGSMIVSPLGEVLAGPVAGREEILVAEIDPSDVVRGKYDLDVVGHYARPDVFRLSVDTTARLPVVFSGAGDPVAAPSARRPDEGREAVPAAHPNGGQLIW